MGEFDPFRWSIYLTVGPTAMATYFLLRSNYLRALILLSVLIFLDQVFLTWRHFYLVNFSISSAFAYTLFGSLLLDRSARARMPAMSAAWAALLTFALFGIVIGAADPRLGMTFQIPEFQFFFAEALLYFWLGRACLRDAEQVNRLLLWVVWFGGIIALTHMVSLATGFTFYTASKVVVVSAVGGTDFRYGSVFVNPNTLADFYAMTIPAAVVLLLGWKKLSRRARISAMVAAGLMSVSLPLTASRGGLAATLLVLGITALLLPVGLRLIVSYVGSGILIGGMTAVGILVLFPEYWDRALTRFQEEGVQGNRYILWRDTLDLLLTNPLGIGLHSFNFEAAIRPYGHAMPSPHNIYLDLATKVGIPGLLAFLAFCVGLFRRLGRARRHGSPELRTAAAAITAMMLGFLLGGITEPIFSNGYKLQHLFFFLAGVGSFLPQWLPSRAAARSSVPVVPPPRWSAAES
ncbi:MAG: O-antigen ligase family protein [Myxococcota bacterium]|nr:O-antigen ligase family protein [Myxococcota bacterium]